MLLKYFKVYMTMFVFCRIVIICIVNTYEKNYITITLGPENRLKINL